MDYGLWSVLPPLAAILLAIFTRRVLPSLLAGVLLGALILAAGEAVEANRAATPQQIARIPAAAAVDALETHLWTNLADSDHLRVFIFTALMGAMVGVISRGGGMNGVVELMAPLARSRRGFQLVTWALGLIVFFDDYANSLLLGSTMRPLADRLKVSREKLAYLVDSTAAPVSGLALISTWIATEISLIEEGYASLASGESEVDGFSVFIATIPYRFYVLWALLLVPLAAIMGRELGAMLRAEQNAKDADDEQSPQAPEKSAADAAAADTPTGHALDAVFPVVVMIGVTVWLLLATGLAALREEGAAGSLALAFGNGDSYLALVYGSLAGLLTAATIVWARRSLAPAQIRTAALEGAIHVLPALAILWLAWTLSGLTKEDYLGTGVYLGELLTGSSVSAAWMPTIVFVLASFVAFSTGTAWGTMGILVPLVVTTTHGILAQQTGGIDAYDPVLVASIGGVLAGAIFGDHCSPISDTTVLSSHASGCSHVEHVRTQMPYALLAAAVAILCGTLPVGFGVSVWPLLPLGAIVLVAGVWVFGRAVK